VSRVAKPSLFLWSTTRRGPGPWDTWQHWSSPLRKAELGAGGHVAAPELPSQEGRARSHGTRGSTGSHLSGRQSPDLRDMWQRQSSPQHGGEVRGRGTRGGAGAHLCREVWSEATAYVTAHGCTSYSLSCLRACMRGYPVFRVPTKAPGPTLGEAANPQVGPILRRPARLS
jgi:hypothetical protein